jgi:F420-dependent oxidoreductase-like protein
MAQQALTVQASSGGRLVLGIGLSHEAVMSKRLGIPFTRPVGHMRDYLEVLMPLLQGARVDHSGVEHHVRLQLGVPGVAAPQVLVGALGPQMLRLTGRLADGAAIWLGGQRYLEDFALPLLNESARKAGRPAPRVAVGLAVAVCDDIDEGREAVGRAIDRSAALPSYRAVLERGGAESASETALIGPEDEVRARLRDLARLGVSDFHAIPVGVGPAADSLARTHALLAECARGLD